MPQRSFKRIPKIQLDRLFNIVDETRSGTFPFVEIVASLEFV